MRKIAVVALALTSIGSNAQQALDAKAAAIWYSGVTVEGKTTDGSSFRAYHDPAGKVRALVAGQFANDGTWKVQHDGSVCVDWRDSSWGQHPCYWIKEETDAFWKIERIDDSRNTTRVKRVEGNKYGM